VHLEIVFSPAEFKQEEWQQVSNLLANQGKYEDALDAYFNYLGRKKKLQAPLPQVKH